MIWSNNLNCFLQGTKIFDIAVRDGDTGKPRKLELEILGDLQNFFVLDVQGHDEKGVLTAALKKSEETILDREIQVKATIYLETQTSKYCFSARQIDRKSDSNKQEDKKMQV